MHKLEVLSYSEIKRIHESTLELFQEIGIIVESKEALNLFKKEGAKVDENTNRVYLSEDLLSYSLEKVPKNFSLYGPDGNYKVDVNMDESVFATIGAAVNLYDPLQKNTVRKTRLRDAIEHIQVINELTNINCSHVDVWPHDIPFTELHYHTIYNWAQYGQKPFGMSCYGRVASQDMIDMLSIILGGLDKLKLKPRLIGIFNPLSPLCLPQILLNGVFIFAKYNQPLLISAASSAGSTSPVTLAGTLVQANMEVLSTITLTQLINPGTPVLYGSTNTILDPITGNVAYGSMEFSLLTIASSQIAQFYGIPSKGSGCLTDSKSFDLQNGFERFLTLYTSMAAGHNYITCAGTYESLLSMGFELLIIDNYLISLLKDLIKTTKNLVINNNNKKELDSLMQLFYDKIIDTNMIEKAKKCLDNSLKEAKKKRLKESIDKKLKELHKNITSRSIEDYQRLENIKITNKKLNIGGVNVN